MNEYINLNLENIESEHICCAISDKKHQEGVRLKKEWLKERIKEGHIFRKLKGRGKVFIEYAPLEKSFCPVIGNNFIYIYCLWVAGSFKGKGYGKELLQYAIDDAKKQNKNGLCVISSKKKKPYLSEKKFFENFGFKIVDNIGEYQLLSLNFKKEIPHFNETAKQMKIKNKDLTIYYSCECPFIENCINEVKEFAEENKIKLNIEKVDTIEKAKNLPCVFNNWAIFYNGEYISNLLLNKNMAEKLFKEKI